MDVAQTGEVEQFIDIDMDALSLPEVLNRSINTDIERTDFTWMIVDFENWFQQLSVRKKGVRENSPYDTSELELLSEEFTRGQHVGRTCTWQMELNRNCGGLHVGLKFNHCYHKDVDEIWARFDTQIIDIHETVLFSKVRTFYDAANVVRYSKPRPLGTGERGYQNWGSELITMSLLAEKWKEYVPRNMLILRLKLYVFRERPAYLQPPPFPNFLPSYLEDRIQTRYKSGYGPLFQGIQDLWNTMEDADIMFKISGNEEVLKAHKLILTVQSSVLKRRIAEAPKITDSDKEFTVLELSSRPIQTLKYVLQYLYYQVPDSYLTKSSDVELLSSVLETSVELGVKRMADLCLSRLITSMKLGNFGRISTIILSNAPEEDPIYKPILQDFFMRNIKNLGESEEFKNETKAHPDTLLQLCFTQFSIKVNDCDRSSGN